ncbi:MAG: LOG family protein [Caulobacteraceae bacterium]
MTDAPNAPPKLTSVCVYCASSNAADPAYLQAAERFGAILAASGVRLVYGGGGVGLMGATARGAHGAGGKVLGVMPAFLQNREMLYDEVETVVVQSMHERKQIMFEQSDAFAVLPGGIGTLEEIVELMSWRRLELHRKPMVFYSPGGFWDPLFKLMDHTIDQNLTPSWFKGTWRSVSAIDEVLPAIRQMMPAGPQRDPTDLV